MLPDFPKLKKQLRLLFRQRLRQSFGHQAPVISELRKHQSHEGDTFTIHRLDGSVSTTAYQKTEVQFTIQKKDLPRLTPQELIAKIDDAAGKMAEEASKHLFEELERAVAEVGNVVNAQGKPISSELLLQMLQKIQMDFDEEGRPRGLTMVVGPKLAEALKLLIPQWESDPEFSRRHRALMEMKREEWRDRESRRKLVD